ncbi:MAG: hypothetical protein KJZ54_13345 [Phycisphaerales bacterium]|nr:hypothetical protein [Phycisphaerales bacterium]
MRPELSGKDGAGGRWAWVRWCLLTAALVVALQIVGYLVVPVPKEFHAEGGPLEMVQVALWIGAAVVACIAVVRRPSRRDALNAGWVALLAALAAARELDLHESLQTERLGGVVVRFRIDWWLDPGVPIAPRIVWAAVFAALIVALVVPPLAVRPPILRLLRSGDAAAWLFFAAGGLLAAGYALDDLLGRGRIVEDIETLQGIEEACELLGAAAFAGSALHTALRPLSRRERAACAALGPDAGDAAERPR